MVCIQSIMLTLITCT